MSPIFGPETFEFFARYVIAGFVLLSVRSRYVAGERPRNAELFFEVVVLSLVNRLVFLLLSSGAQVTGLAARLPVPPPDLVFLAEVLLLPVLLGVLAGINLRRGWDRALLRRLAMPVQHPIRTGYDFAFAERLGPGFVIISFRDGVEVRGYFGTASLASSDASRSDIFLERVYDVAEDGSWLTPNPPRSAYVALADVRSIEFLQDRVE